MKHLVWLVLLTTGFAQGQTNQLYLRGGLSRSHFTGESASSKTQLWTSNEMINPGSWPPKTTYATNFLGRRFQSGFMGGLGWRHRLSTHWAFRTELNYEQAGGRIDPLRNTPMKQIAYGPPIRFLRDLISLPLVAEYSQSLSPRWRLYGFAGLQIAYQLKALEKGRIDEPWRSSLPTFYEYTYNRNETYRQTDFGGLLGLGTQGEWFGQQVGLEIRYQTGLLNVVSPTMTGKQRGRMEFFQASVLYYLPL
ncbi:porin family protein [Siphonobacter curvatus]|uniref:Outer membrane protein beta-barrel domain-containing protein n=1 Tax=Siphonobacter curvatus TaxID=2094562 RepID=A0A2S7IFE7_9BACT|nr:porin family protein [Siphonobacter curvatus]PQA53750.1 hypothetical protein C5O19_24045 [Siphonobacter curvatus]